MACFLVPVAEAVVTTVAEVILKSKKSFFAVKLGWLNKALWGGSALLAFEHVWHGEVIPTFPFLTAVRDGNVSEMLGEMARNGVAMALSITAVWGIALTVIRLKKNKRKVAL